MTHFNLWPLKLGSHDKVAIDFFKALIIVYKMTPSTFELELFSYFMWLTFLTPVTPNDPGWIFRPISFVAINPYMLLTKFGKNPIKHVEEEAECEKKKELDMLPSQTAYPAGFETSTPDWPQFPCFPANVMQVYELHEYTW